LATSLALIILLGMAADALLKRLRMPGLIGMLAVGVLMGPHVLDVLDPELLRVSADFRMVALIVILLRAGLETRRDTLNRIGKTALLMSVVPALLEGAAIALMAPPLLGLTLLEGAILGAIVAAVSPAVVVPFMLTFIDERRGTDKGIPTLILAASSVDDVFVIVVFYMLLGFHGGQGGSVLMKMLELPLSVGLGMAVGTGAGLVLYVLFKRKRTRATKMSLVVVGTAVLLTWLEEELRGIVPFSALLGVMTIGFILLEKLEQAAHLISRKLAKVWVLAEILLFALVGAQVDIHVAWQAGLAGAVLIAGGLAARSAGTYLCMLGTDLTRKERLFCVVAYLPKATVQAAIGALPLAVGVAGGNVILAVAVLSIVLTAPLGAWGIDVTGRRFLSRPASQATQ
jgi:NhaP-type Na+/H+ or K+/H+ antiporter